MSDVTDLLDQLIAGDTDLDAVAEDFRSRAWPRRTRTNTSDANDLFTLDSQDPEVEPDGSFSEVAGYYSQHKIDEQTYAQLATAAAEAMKSAPTPGTPAAGVNQGTEPTP